MDRLIGIFLIAVSAVSFGANPIFARIAYDAGANPSTFLFFRFAIASAVMFLIMIIGNFKFPRGRLLFTLVMMGGVGIVGATISTTFGSVAFFAGLKRIDTSNTSIISTLEVVVSIALAIIVLGETITLPKIIGATMIISAVAILAKSEYKVADVKIR